MAIKVLDRTVVNQISAGEVVEKPASIVKELLENSIDAGAKNITVEICGGGIEKIVVIDDGCGIPAQEVKLAFTPHATSKFEKIEDFNMLETMGFRGEALASISAVSKVTMVTKTEEQESAIKIELQGGEEVSSDEVASVRGTKIEVTDIFYNTPARLKFLRKPKCEENDITSYVQKIILSHNDICFKYIVDGKVIYNTRGGSLIDNIYAIYGAEVANNLIEIDYKRGDYRIYGYISTPELGKPNRTYQTLFVNNRYCIDSKISNEITNVYSNYVLKGKFPLYILFISTRPYNIDCNVHPNKLQVKFAHPNVIYDICSYSVYWALQDYIQIRNVDIPQDKNVSSAYDKNYSDNSNSENEFNIGLSEEEKRQRNNREIFEKNSNSSGTFRLENNTNALRLSEIEGTNPSAYWHKLENNNIDDNFMEQVNQLNNLDTTGKTQKEIFDMYYDFVEKNTSNELFGASMSSQNLQQNIQNPEDMIEISLGEDNTKQKLDQQKFVPEQQDYKNLFDDEYRLVGKIFNTYLILEQKDRMYLIDQHAAHERQRYDALVAELDSQMYKKQDLLVPYIFSTSSQEYNFLISNLELINSFGIDISEFGNNSFKVSAIPMAISGIDLKEYFNDMLSNMGGIARSPKEIIREKLMQMACKSAVKGGDDLKDIEIKALLKKLKEETKVLLCPHGRPIIVEISLKQIEKWFKRIVD